MKVKLATLLLGVTILGGCGNEVVVGPIELPPSQDGNIKQVAKTTTYVKNIFIKYQNRFDVNVAVADFEPKGIILGVASPLIPLSDRESQLQSLGFITHISKDGQEAMLQYNDSVLRFKVGDKTLFLDDKPGIQMPDNPIYNNSTIYVPIIPILDALKIDYEISGEDLIIGGMYTDESGDITDTGTVGEQQPEQREPEVLESEDGQQYTTVGE